jgi:hypothetical protein
MKPAPPVINALFIPIFKYPVIKSLKRPSRIDWVLKHIFPANNKLSALGSLSLGRQSLFNAVSFDLLDLPDLVDLINQINLVFMILTGPSEKPRLFGKK